MNRYYGFFPALAARGIAVHGFDQRGWGRSVTKPEERGLTGPTAQVLADVAAFLAPHLPAGPADPPVFVMGHSMGGGEALTLAADPAYAGAARRVRGWLLESPFVAFAPEQAPSPLSVLAGRLAGRLLPRRRLRSEVPAENCTRDAAVAQSIREDALCHQTGTLEGLAGLLDRTAALTSRTVKLRGDVVRSVWFGHGTEDKVTHFESSKRFYDECTLDVPDRTFRVYEGWYHQLHADGKDSEIFYQEVGDWILARVGDDRKVKAQVRDGRDGAKAEAKL